jgi:4-hydroxy-tetrahydrodipicolinate synthase
MAFPLTPTRPFGRVLTAMATPFNDDGSLDLPAVEHLAQYLIDHGHDGIVVNGTTGEAPTTTDEEKTEVIRAVRRTVGSEIQIVAGVGTNDTAHTVALAEQAADAGANGLLVVAPYYSRPSQEGIIQHFLRVADATALGVMIYDIPGRTGVHFTEKTLARLGEHPRILAVKDATGDVGGAFHRMLATGLAYYSGDDLANLALLAGGAAGVVSVVGHVVGDSWLEMADAIDASDLPRARRVFASTLPVIGAIMGGGQGAVMVKAALEILEVLDTRTVRLPLFEANEIEMGHIREALATCHLGPRR